MKEIPIVAFTLCSAALMLTVSLVFTDDGNVDVNRVSVKDMPIINMNKEKNISWAPEIPDVWIYYDLLMNCWNPITIPYVNTSLLHWSSVKPPNGPLVFLC